MNNNNKILSTTTQPIYENPLFRKNNKYEINRLSYDLTPELFSQILHRFGQYQHKLEFHERYIDTPSLFLSKNKIYLREKCLYADGETYRLWTLKREIQNDNSGVVSFEIIDDLSEIMKTLHHLFDNNKNEPLPWISEYQKTEPYRFCSLSLAFFVTTRFVFTPDIWMDFSRWGRGSALVLYACLTIKDTVNSFVLSLQTSPGKLARYLSYKRDSDSKIYIKIGDFNPYEILFSLKDDDTDDEDDNTDTDDEDTEDSDEDPIDLFEIKEEIPSNDDKEHWWESL
jgi:hypothetical protein